LAAVSSTAHGRVDAYLGIDVGSISTNLVVIDERSEVLSSRYLMTAGRPIEAIKRGLKEIGDEIAHSVVIKGVGTTGSGRYLTGDFVGADVIKNEITAQATAATHIDPDVDTIFEIGGQDSKYISLKDGAIVDFEMNKVCAAGTGSFLEEQAEKLGISIKEEFGGLALKAPQPVPLGERCTVFIESDLVHHQQRGASRENLVAGLSCSIVLNYLNKVVGDRKIGERIFFQGGTAFNVGVVAAFEKVLGRTVAVPENHHVTGAIGAAIVAMRERGGQESRFKGFDLSRRSYELTSFECRGCPNVCEIRKLTVEGEKPLYYGGRCEKYEVREETLKDTIPNLFTEREEFLERTWGETERPAPGAPEIGIPRTMFFQELLPLFRTFFEALGFRVVLSDKTHKGTIHRGVEAVLSEACFPIKVGHGHILNLIEKGVKTIFLPSVIEMPLKDERVERNFTCPYVQALPYTVRSAINFGREGVRLLNPVLNFRQDQRQAAKAFRRLGKELGKSSRQVTKALEAAVCAQNAFYESCRRRGREILENLGPDAMAMVVISRPYNGCDSGINLNLPQKVIDLGVIPIPLDFVPEDEAQPSRDSFSMYWSYGRRILAVAQLLRRDPRLRAIYLTNFGCGPDSFISHFFKEELTGSPHLIIEIDEHSADVGMITRLEAFLDSLKGAGKEKTRPMRARRLRTSRNGPRTIYLSYMTDHAFPLAAAFEACGRPAQVLPESDEETLKWGRKLTSGRECYPCILTTGDMAKKAKSRDFDPERSAFFMPGGRGPCRFGQYHRFHRLVLDELGFEGVPILAPIQDDGLCNELGAMGDNFMRIAWEGVVAADLLEKKARETRPYERHPGETDRMYRHFLEEACETTRKRGNILGVLERAREAFDGIETMGGAKPIIGIVGEIYIRSNRFSNEDIVRSLEQLGAEVWLPPIGEWILYTNYTAKRHTLVKGDYLNLIRNVVVDRMQQAIEHRMEAVFRGSLKNIPEPTTKEVITKALPYLHPSFEGEAILSMGKAVDFKEKGVCGIINTMPFTCMPGTIVTALLKRFREDHDDIPVLSMSYDGQKETNALTRLEAFVHQVRQRHRDA
jgi:predicted CoA-substrate-specific enzyme activase